MSAFLHAPHETNDLLSKKIGYWLVLLLTLSVPISTAVTSVTMILILVLWFATGQWHQKAYLYWRHPLTPPILVLLCLGSVGLIYTQTALSMGLESFKDYVRLAYIPILAYYISHPSSAKRVAQVFIMAMIVTLILGYCKVYGGLPIGEKYTMGSVFKSHIKTSFFMSIAAFILAVQWINSPSKWWLGLGLLLMIHYLFFLSYGRIGHVTIILLALFAAWYYKKAKGLMFAMVAVTGVVIIAYTTSDIFAKRIDILKQDWAIYQTDGQLIKSSLGSRLTFYQVGLSIFAKHPIKGVGTGGFESAYDDYIAKTPTLATDNPHNQYIKMMVELGLLGLAALLYLFVKTWQLAQQVPLSSHRLIIQGGLCAFYVGCCLNSWVSDFTEGFFFVVFCAVAFASMADRATKTVPSSALKMTGQLT